MKLRNLWRLAGAACLAASFAMVLLSGRFMHSGMSKVALAAYWIVFVILLMGALYAALLDLRFTRIEYKVRERDLFRKTFMTDEFRQTVAEAQKQASKEQSPPKTS
ncbi:MAG: hypothetical protein GXY07_02515 [Candidatus Hydrogenedentes bacterium]|jgi:hypothetical protein|nr:hypothetical protein [Candidatus Hydrogenedentota bacterium]